MRVLHSCSNVSRCSFVREFVGSSLHMQFVREEHLEVRSESTCPLRPSSGSPLGPFIPLFSLSLSGPSLVPFVPLLSPLSASCPLCFSLVPFIPLWFLIECSHRYPSARSTVCQEYSYNTELFCHFDECFVATGSCFVTSMVALLQERAALLVQQSLRCNLQ